MRRFLLSAPITDPLTFLPPPPVPPFVSAVTHSVSALGCGPHYEYAIEEFCLAKFRLDMQELDQRHWCSWEDTVE